MEKIRSNWVPLKIILYCVKMRPVLGSRAIIVTVFTSTAPACIELGYIHICMYTCMYTCIYVCIHVYMYVCMYVGMYVCMYVCMECYCKVE
jgi:hypothetical protein